MSTDSRARPSDQTFVPVGDIAAGAPVQVLDVLASGATLWDELRNAARRAGRGQPLQGARLRRGVGFARKPPEFLKVGDVMEAEIEKIGVLGNTIAAFDPAGAATGQLTVARAG